MSLRAFGLLAASALLASAALPASAMAADGIAVQSGTLRAGPATDYPAVGHVRSGEPLTIYGCIRGYTWCDVSTDADRGWFPGARIAFIRQGHRVFLPEVAPEIGIGIVGFGVDEYWQDHYRNRPFYNHVDRFHDHRGQSAPDHSRPNGPPGARPDHGVPPTNPPIRHDENHGGRVPGAPRLNEQHRDIPGAPRPDEHRHGAPDVHTNQQPLRNVEPPRPPEQHVAPPVMHTNPAPEQHINPPQVRANPPQVHNEAPQAARPPAPAPGAGCSSPICGK